MNSFHNSIQPRPAPQILEEADSPKASLLTRVMQGIFCCIRPSNRVTPAAVSIERRTLQAFIAKNIEIPSDTGENIPVAILIKEKTPMDLQDEELRRIYNTFNYNLSIEEL